MMLNTLPITPAYTLSCDDRRDGARPSLIIIHYTNTPTADGALARYHEQKPTDGFGRLSPHYLIAQAGHIWQLVAEDRRAWHAGLSWWKDYEDINSHSIGIELAGLGDVFPDRQLASLVPLVKQIMQRWDIPPENVLGHNDIAPDRKVDPGPNFPWKALAAKGIGIWPEETGEAVVQQDVIPVLRAIGYTAEVSDRLLLTGFQTHFVPELFAEGGNEKHIGTPTLLTCQRLFALRRILCHK